METISLKEKRIFTKKPTSIPKNWWKENRFFNHFFNSLSLILPVGELFFIKSMKLHQKSIKCEKLRKNVDLFIFQETNTISETKPENETNGNEKAVVWREMHDITISRP